MNSPIEDVLSIIQSAQRFVLTTHVNPDGDAIGSEVAFAEWLASRGKNVSIINHSPTPAVYQFLDPHGRILQYDNARDDETIVAADVLLVLDTNHPDRLRSMAQSVLTSRATKICIDHHLEPGQFADHYIVDDDATSTGEILYRLFERVNGRNLPAVVAQALYCAIMTDSGSFRYPRVDPETFRICANLVECGADPVAIYSSVFERWSDGRIHLLGQMLAGLKTEFSGKLAYVTITQDMLRRTGTNEEDTDNFTTYPMSMDGVAVGILFLQLSRGLKISFRSKGEIPINELAKEFGGNGHKNAAGARLYEGSLEQVQRNVLNAAAKYVV
jgi:phosphoesterase RecJ-like protein